MTTDEISDKPRVPVEELEELVEVLRSNQHGKQESANKSTSAQSKKYNQGAAYAYCLSANSLEALIERYDNE